MKKTFILIILTVFILAGFISCEMKTAAVEENHDGLATVRLAASQEKNLESSVNRDIKTWEFRATPQFQLAAGEFIYGTVSEWKTLADLSTGSDNKVKTETTLGRYTSGEWLFEVRCLNSNKNIIAIGSKKQIVREGLPNIVNIIVYVDRRDGTNGESAKNGSLKVGFEINRLDYNLENLQVVTTSQKINKNGSAAEVKTVAPTWKCIPTDGNTPEANLPSLPTWYKENAKVGKGRIFYEGDLANIEPGPYIFVFKVQGKNTAGTWIDLAGQAVEVMVLGGEQTTVKGTTLANEYVVAGLKITAPGKIVGSINGKTYVIGVPGTPVTLKYTHNTTESAETPKSFVWYVNGTIVPGQTTDTLSFDCPKTPDPDGKYIFGIYKVAVVPIGDLGSLGNEVIDIIYNPPAGPNQGEFPAKP